MTTKKISELPEHEGNITQDDVILLTNPNAPDGSKSKQINVNSFLMSTTITENEFIYVTKEGDDSNDGSETKPFATIGRALTYLLSVKTLSINSESTATLRTILSIGEGVWDNIPFISITNQFVSIVGSGSELTTLNFIKKGIQSANSNVIISNLTIGVGSGVNAINSTSCSYIGATDLKIIGDGGGVACQSGYSSTLLLTNVTITGSWTSNILIASMGGSLIGVGVFIDTTGGVCAINSSYNGYLNLKDFDIKCLGLSNFPVYATEDSTIHLLSWGANKSVVASTAFSWGIIAYRNSCIGVNGVEFDILDSNGSSTGVYSTNLSRVEITDAVFSNGVRTSPSKSSSQAPSYGNNQSFISG